MYGTSISLKDSANEPIDSGRESERGEVKSEPCVSCMESVDNATEEGREEFARGEPGSPVVADDLRLW